MTPFGEKMRKLRTDRAITLKQMSSAIGVSSAYLSALEHGKRGRPGWHLIQRIIAYFNIIWDEAEEVTRLARISHPRITIDTSVSVPEHVESCESLVIQGRRPDSRRVADVDERESWALCPEQSAVSQ